MRLYEEFKEYETMWDLKEAREPSELQKLLQTKDGYKHFDTLPKEEKDRLLRDHKAHEDQAPANIVLAKMGKIPLEYEGFERDWYEDGFDPDSWYGHTQNYGTDRYGAFTYEVEAKEIFEIIYDIIQKYIDKVEPTELLNQFKVLNTKFLEASDEEYDDACEALDLFMAENLEELVKIFNEQVLDQFREQAEDWAVENKEYYEPDYYEDN